MRRWLASSLAVATFVVPAPFFAAATGGSTPTVTAAESATLSVTPDTIVVASGEVTATVKLTNTAETAIRDIVLTSRINGSGSYRVVLDPGHVEERVLPPGGDVAWQATVTSSGGLGPAIVWFRADFIHEPPHNNAAASPQPTVAPEVPGVATASLTLTADAVMASAEVQGGAGDLTDLRSRPLEVLVTNQGATAVDAKVTAHRDDMVDIRPPEPITQTIAPNATVGFRFDIQAATAIQPGDRTLLFDVDLKSGLETRRLVVSHTVTLGVLGDAQISGLLGIPVFFLVPGTLVLIVWQLLGSFFGRLTKRNLPTSQSKEFWVVAIGLSLLLAPLYPPFTGFLGSLGWIQGGERDYLRGYGTLDVLIVWGVAFLLPATLFVIGLVTKAALGRDEVSEKDSPLGVLKKLATAKGSLARRQVTISGRTALLLEDRPRDERYWIGPKIEIEWRADIDPDNEEKVRRQLDADGNVRLLHDDLKRAVDAGRALVRFVIDGPLTGPRQASISELGFAGEDLLVTERG